MDLVFSSCHLSSSSSNGAAPVWRGLPPLPSGGYPQPQLCTRIRHHGSLWWVRPVPNADNNVRSRYCCAVSSSSSSSSLQSWSLKACYSSKWWLSWPARMLSLSSLLRLAVQADDTVTQRSCGDGGRGLAHKEVRVDIDAGTVMVQRIVAMVPGVSGFGRLCLVGESYLVAGTDRVGTELKLAFRLDIDGTVEINLVAMSINDIVTGRAKSLVFLHYFTTGRLEYDAATEITAGFSEGCRQSDCALLGGKMGEMPSFYPDGEYDLSVFVVGAVTRYGEIDGPGIKAGNITGIEMVMVINPSTMEEILSWGPDYWQGVGPNLIPIGEVVPGNGVIPMPS